MNAGNSTAMGDAQALKILAVVHCTSEELIRRTAAFRVVHAEGIRIIGEWARGDHIALRTWRERLDLRLAVLWRRGIGTAGNLPKENDKATRYFKKVLRNQRRDENRPTGPRVPHLPIAGTDYRAGETEGWQTAERSIPDTASISPEDAAAWTEAQHSGKEWDDLAREMADEFCRELGETTGESLLNSVTLFFEDSFRESMMSLALSGQASADPVVAQRLYRNLLEELGLLAVKAARTISRDPDRQAFASNLGVLFQLIAERTTVETEAVAAGASAATIRKRMQRVRMALLAALHETEPEATGARLRRLNTLEKSIRRMKLRQGGEQ